VLISWLTLDKMIAELILVWQSKLSPVQLFLCFSNHSERLRKKKRKHTWKYL